MRVVKITMIRCLLAALLASTMMPLFMAPAQAAISEGSETDKTDNNKVTVQHSTQANEKPNKPEVLPGKKSEKGLDTKSKSDRKSTDERQSTLDQGLIEAQIDDVFSSEEFLTLKQSADFQPADDKPPAKKPPSKTQDQEAEPEALLKQLDKSDLMDYVAEDDLWKEQLTIEDEPG